MSHLPTDQYTRVTSNCPMSIDLHPVDDVIEIILGDYRTDGDTLRLVIDNPDTVLRLSTTLHDARTRLVEHLRGKANLRT
jgi:hypothetical protein